jgi:hypothetical protein
MLDRVPTRKRIFFSKEHTHMLQSILINFFTNSYSFLLQGGKAGKIRANHVFQSGADFLLRIKTSKFPKIIMAPQSTEYKK